MALRDLRAFEDLQNEAERLVIDELERQLDMLPDDKVCKTDDCVLDMAAYALNHVRPLYRVNLLGRLYATAPDDERNAEISRAVAEAIRKISENPSR
jgi:competence protein ComFB